MTQSLNATVSIPKLTGNVMQQEGIRIYWRQKGIKDVIYSHIFHTRHAQQHHACFLHNCLTEQSRLVRKVV